MKTFKKIMIVLLVIIGLLVIISLFLPKKYEVKRSVNIKANKSLIFSLVSHYNQWDLWAPWTKAVDSTAVFTLTGEDGKVGTKRSWIGKRLGDGSMIISSIVQDQTFGYEIEFDHGKYQSQGRFDFETTGDSVKVTWIDGGDLGYNPLSRFMGLFMDKMMGPDFEKGLGKLRKIAEERNSWPTIEEKIMPEQTVLLIRDSAEMKSYSKVMGKAYQEIFAFVGANKIKCTGSPFAIYIKWDSVTFASVMDIGIPVEKADNGKARIRVERIAAQKILQATYFGPYDKIAPVYNALHQYAKEGGFILKGGPWEVYVTDPMKEKDPSKLQTLVLFPLK